MPAHLERKQPTAIDEQDPWKGDVLNRKECATFLMKLLESNENGLVLNVDAPWGTGKSFFLERWRQWINGDYATVWFNAWQSDFAEDPLVACLSEFSEQLSRFNRAAGEPLERLAKTGARLATKAAPLLVEVALRKILGDRGIAEVKDIFDPQIEDAIAESLTKAAAHAVKDHLQKKKAVEDFRKVLNEAVIALTKTGRFQRPLFVFVDELDRCRPTYAIELLEKIKHLFSVPGVVFVIATNTSQLKEAIRAVYGGEFDSDTYLRRFFDQTFRLPRPSAESYSKLLHAQVDMDRDFEGKRLFCPGDYTRQDVFAELASGFDLSLRDQEQAFLRLVAIVRTARGIVILHYSYLCILVMSEIKQGDLCDRLRSGELRPGDFMKEIRSKLAGHAESKVFNASTGYFSVCTTENSLQDALIRLKGNSNPLAPNEVAARRLLEAVQADWKGFQAHTGLVNLARQLGANEANEPRVDGDAAPARPSGPVE